MRTISFTLASVLLLAACRKDDQPAADGADGSDGSDTDLPVDADGDGTLEAEDCDDGDATIYPGADELCDGVDNDCDGDIDEGLTAIYYLDLDGDGFGNDALAEAACDPPAGSATVGGDCDDDDPDSYPDAAERCDDLDNDCDGDIDEDVLGTWFADADGDGFGNAARPLDSCDPPVGFTADDSDCDDLDPLSYPGAEETCDEADNNCDGTVDEGVRDTFYTDADGDGWGQEDLPVEACTLPVGAASRFGDCDDSSAAISPVATELCDGVDNDCDGNLDEDDAANASSWYADADGDGFGDAASLVLACAAPSGTVSDNRDCDDSDAAISPAAAEVCDGADNDCNGIVDRVDDDADGFLAQACGGGDCDDADASINPRATEIFYDGIDQNCDSASDYDADGDGQDSDAHGGTDCDDSDRTIYLGAPDVPYDGIDADCAGDSDYDADGDGYDATAYGGTDCNDADASINPDAIEIFDGVDQNCDGISDYDLDGDGYVATTYGGGDCDDADPTINPAATDTPYDGIDQNCDGLNDYDVDQDGYEWDGAGGTDCDDGASNVNPSRPEICEDGIDNNCDGYADGCGPYGDRLASEADAIVTGVSAGDRLAQGDPGFASAGDVNNDGNGDLLVAAIRNSDAGYRAGSIYLFHGPITGNLSASAADATLRGEAAEDLAGYGVTGVGDVNNDGYDDIFVTAQQNDAGGLNAGAAYVVLGPITGTFGLGAADARWTGVGANDQVSDPAYGGDINGDGTVDLLVGAQFNDTAGTDAGAAYILFGPGTAGGSLASADVVITGEAIGDEAGSSLWAEGDVDGNGIADVLVGARKQDGGGADSGALYVLLGPVTTSTSLANADAKWVGAHPGAEIGWGVSVSTAGDVNGDGYDDILVGARFDNDVGTYAGAAYLILGPVTTGTSASLATADAKLLGELARDFTGDAVHGPGDIDADGFDDLLIGSGYNDAGAANGGAVYIVNGPVTGTVSLASFDGAIRAEGADDRARGHGVGDLDNDGHADVMLGAMLNDRAGLDAGAVYLFYGSGL